MQIGFLYHQDDKRCPISARTLQKFEAKFDKVLIESALLEPVGLELEGEKLSLSSRSEIISNADILYSNVPLTEEEASHAKENAIVVSHYQIFNPEEHAYSASLPIKAASMDMIPRTTLAQSMDVLSSMASIAGYKAVLTAAMHLPRYFPMMMTAAGTIKPATVLILGAGVAGLQAIATAKRLGARVEAFDVRAAVKTEVESLGAKFVEVEGATDDKDAGGYAVEQTEDYKRKQQEKIAERVANADAVITTAQLRGRPAPKLITAEMVKAMKYGSVIVDMASSTGGNCELTEDQKTVVKEGVTIIGNSNLAAEALIDASDLLANNIHDYIMLFVTEEGIHADMENEIIQKSIIYPRS